MRYHYVWLAWSSAFLVPWAALYLLNPKHRRVMWRASLVTSLFGLTEPIFVPRYWNPPSLFELAQRTGFDIESLVFCFAIGGIGSTLYNCITRQDLVPLSWAERRSARHRFHPVAIAAPFVLFVPLYLLPWNPIWPSIVCLVVGAIAAVICRPDLLAKTFVGGALFLFIYAAFMLGLKDFAPGYIGAAWNLPALSGVLVYGVPLEELLFGFGFGMYWTGVYEHLTWNRAVGAVPAAAHSPPQRMSPS